MRHILFLAAIRTLQAKKTEMKIATTKEPLKEVFDSGMKRPIGLEKPLIVNFDKFLKMVLDNLLEIVGRSTRTIPRAGIRSG